MRYVLSLRETGRAKVPTSRDQSAHECETARLDKACVASAADDVYELVQHRPRGFAVIVNIAKGRPGSEKDVSMMTDLFSQLHYEVMTFEDVTKEVCSARTFGLLTCSSLIRSDYFVMCGNLR